MALKLFNSLTRKKEVFAPVSNENLVRMYTCGPTVHDFAHIGNFRTFIFEDVLRRFLKYKGFALIHVMNLTDVDDKIIRKCNEEKKSLREFTDHYVKIFFEDCKTLNIEQVEFYPRASECIPEMVQLIQCLLDKGFAYKTEDGIYFAIQKFKSYGKLARIDLKNLKPGASGRIIADEYEKENVADFALWKYWDEKDGNVFWETQLGKGRPGWHIECSAMSAKHLTAAFEPTGFDSEKFSTIDLHAGGVDLLFPHHEDEIAQTEACFGKKFCRLWLHAEHLLVDNKKMSKSLGNFYTLRDLLAKGYDEYAIRFLLLSTHYRTKLNFTLESLSSAKAGLYRLQECVYALLELKNNPSFQATPSSQRFTQICDLLLRKFERYLDNDLDISKVLAVVFEFISKVNVLIAKEKIGASDAENALNTFRKLNSVLGVLSFEHNSLPADLAKLIKQREQARNKKNWKESDRLREELLSKGVLVEDTPTGSRWRLIKK